MTSQNVRYGRIGDFYGDLLKISNTFYGTAPPGDPSLNPSIQEELDKAFTNSIYFDSVNGNFYKKGADGLWTIGATVGAGDGVKNNFLGIGRPTVDNDSSEGYAVGSRWFNQGNKTMWTCFENGVGVAQWNLMASVELFDVDLIKERIDAGNLGNINMSINDRDILNLSASNSVVQANRIPTATDDLLQYLPGTLWVDGSTDPITVWILADATGNDAKWIQIIDSGGNGVEAESLLTTGASVNVSLNAPPTIGQVLKATSATTSEWSDNPDPPMVDINNDLLGATAITVDKTVSSVFVENTALFVATINIDACEDGQKIDMYFNEGWELRTTGTDRQIRRATGAPGAFRDALYLHSPTGGGITFVVRNSGVSKWILMFNDSGGNYEQF